MSFNQGLSARTVLTNRSKFITIILDDKNEKETLSKRFTNAKCYRKGSRLMHNTTLTLEKQPVFNNVSTTTTEVKFFTSKVSELLIKTEIIQLRVEIAFCLRERKVGQVLYLKERQRAKSAFMCSCIYGPIKGKFATSFSMLYISGHLDGKQCSSEKYT